MTIIPLGTALLPCSCDLPGGSDAPSRYVSRQAGTPSLFGLAPCGVYRALSIAVQAVRSYRTFSPLPRRTGAVYFLWHWPSCSLDAESPDVIRHTALRSSDFPPRQAGATVRSTCLSLNYSHLTTAEGRHWLAFFSGVDRGLGAGVILVGTSRSSRFCILHRSRFPFHPQPTKGALPNVHQNR